MNALPVSGAAAIGADRTAGSMISPASAEQRQDAINQLRSEAKAVLGLLSAVYVLPESDKQATLETCSRLANKMAGDLAALAQGSA